MDTLTHGLFGVAIAALRPREAGPLSVTDKAVLLGCVLAAELPDLDYLLPAADPVLVTLRAHRGLSHALVMAPVVAGSATLVAKLAFRAAPTRAIFVQALAAVVFGHLLPDLWTGWGTRVFLPWSDARATFDWTMVIDPWVTLPLLVGAVMAWRARDYRRPLWIGLGVTLAYLGLRVGLRASLEGTVEARYGTTQVHVFPAPLAVLEWRYVVDRGDDYAVGTVSVGRAAVERAVHPRRAAGDLPRHRVIDEVLAWARFPVLKTEARTEGGMRVTVADLRYHAGGAPTLQFVVDVDGNGALESARLDRGGSLRDLFERFLRASD